VEGFDAADCKYRVKYDDGDAEDISWEELGPHVVQPAPPEYEVGDEYSFKIDDDHYKGMKQILKELGWWIPGMTQHGVAKKVKLSRGDIFVSREGDTMVRVNFVNKKHKSLQDCLGDPTCHVFERGDGDLWHLKTGAGHLPIPFRERDYRYVRPSSLQVNVFV